MRLLGSTSHFLPRTRLALIFGAVLIVAGALWRALPAQETRIEREIAPGLTLISVNRPTAIGPLEFWIVRAEKQKNWKLGLETADAQNILKKRTVRALAAQSGARVAINGGFFAYGGAAVGAVKISGEWHRLPWKNRTSLGWKDDGPTKIGPLSGTATVTLGDKTLSGITVNGQSRAYSFEKTNGFALLTARFGKEVRVPPTLTALFIEEGRVAEISKGVAEPAPIDLPPIPNSKIVADRGAAFFRALSIPANGFLLLSLDPAQNNALNVPVGTPAAFQIGVQPDDWNEFPHILGAGPRLLENGQVKTTEIEEEFRPDVVQRGPRTAVGLDKEGNWLFLVANGRQVTSVGLTIPEAAALFQEFGAVEAMNLDGGSSTQLVVDGELVNSPSAFDPVNPNARREVQVTNALTLFNAQ